MEYYLSNDATLATFEPVSKNGVALPERGTAHEQATQSVVIYLKLAFIYCPPHTLFIMSTYGFKKKTRILGKMSF